MGTNLTNWHGEVFTDYNGPRDPLDSRLVKGKQLALTIAQEGQAWLKGEEKAALDEARRRLAGGHSHHHH